MMNLRNLGSKESLGVKFKCGSFVELCLKLWFESDWYFDITESGWFWKRLSRNKVPNNHFLKSVWKSNCPESVVELWSIISNQIINCQFPHRRFDQIGDHNHGIRYLYGQLHTKLISASSAKKKILRSCLRKLGDCFFLKYGFRSECPEKFWTKTYQNPLEHLQWSFL